MGGQASRSPWGAGALCSQGPGGARKSPTLEGLRKLSPRPQGRWGPRDRDEQLIAAAGERGSARPQAPCLLGDSAPRGWGSGCPLPLHPDLAPLHRSSGPRLLSTQLWRRPAHTAVFSCDFLPAGHDVRPSRNFQGNQNPGQSLWPPRGGGTWAHKWSSFRENGVVCGRGTNPCPGRGWPTLSHCSLEVAMDSAMMEMDSSARMPGRPGATAWPTGWPESIPVPGPTACHRQPGWAQTLSVPPPQGLAQPVTGLPGDPPAPKPHSC